MNPIWLLRMKRWVQNPPSARKVWMVLGILALCLTLWAVERFIGWPDALSLPARMPRP